MNAPTNLSSLKPSGTLEWVLMVFLVALALTTPATLIVWMWPAMTGWVGFAMFGVTLAVGLFISGILLWLFAPLVFLVTAVLAGGIAAVQGAWRLINRP